jgi:hypothetical protein
MGCVVRVVLPVVFIMVCCVFSVMFIVVCGVMSMSCIFPVMVIVVSSGGVVMSVILAMMFVMVGSIVSYIKSNFSYFPFSLFSFISIYREQHRDGHLERFL